MSMSLIYVISFIYIEWQMIKYFIYDLTKHQKKMTQLVIKKTSPYKRTR